MDDFLNILIKLDGSGYMISSHAGCIEFGPRELDPRTFMGIHVKYINVVVEDIQAMSFVTERIVATITTSAWATVFDLKKGMFFKHGEHQFRRSDA